MDGIHITAVIGDAMSLTDFIEQYENTDPRSIKAREILDTDEPATLLYKVPRAGCTTSMSAEILKRGETSTSIEPTNRINSQPLKKAAELSGTGKTIIPILSNANCVYNKELIETCPEVARLGILPLHRCEDMEGVRCKHYDRCPITRPLRQVSGVGGYAITYQKLVALSISTGKIAKEILSTVLATDHLIFDEVHTIAYPDTIAVQVHPEIDISKYIDLDYPVLPDVVSGFIDVLTNASDAIEQINADALLYTHKHLAHQITMDRIFKESKDIGAGIRSLIELMINRSDYDLTVDEVVTLKDMLLLCAERRHVVHGVISTNSDGSKKTRIFIKTSDAMSKATIQSTLTNYLDNSCRTRHVWLTSGTIPDMDGVLPVEPTPLMFGDPLDTNSMFAVIADRWRVSVKTLHDTKRFNQIIDDIRNVVDQFGDEKCTVCVMNKKWHDKVENELKDYKNLQITWYASDLTIGVESDRRIMIAVGLAEKPKNAYDAVALSRSDGNDLGAVSDKLRVERVHIDTWQAWSRAKDPEGDVRSLVVALGCRSDDVKNVVTWCTNRKLEMSGVKTTTGGSRTYYDVVGDGIIGEKVRIIERGMNDDVNELAERWLNDGDTTPLTMKSFNAFFERHEGEELTIRSIHQGMHLTRRDVTQKDTERFLSDKGYPVTKNPLVISKGKVVTESVTKNPYKPPPLSQQVSA